MTKIDFDKLWQQNPHILYHYSQLIYSLSFPCVFVQISNTNKLPKQVFPNTVSSQTRMKTNLRTVWTAFVSFGLPYRCYAFASIVTVYAVTCSRLSQSALCSGARHHHLAIFNHIASALHESRTCLFFLKFFNRLIYLESFINCWSWRRFMTRKLEFLQHSTIILLVWESTYRKMMEICWKQNVCVHPNAGSKWKLYCVCVFTCIHLVKNLINCWSWRRFMTRKLSSYNILHNSPRLIIY